MEENIKTIINEIKQMDSSELENYKKKIEELITKLEHFEKERMNNKDE